jgi:predicted small metal-binding protein
MKSMTCRELGGPCDRELRASSWNEMVGAMTKHVMEHHPDTTREMQRMHQQDPDQWRRQMKPKWEASPDIRA